MLLINTFIFSSFYGQYQIYSNVFCLWNCIHFAKEYLNKFYPDTQLNIRFNICTIHGKYFLQPMERNVLGVKTVILTLQRKIFFWKLTFIILPSHKKSTNRLKGFYSQRILFYSFVKDGKILGHNCNCSDGQTHFGMERF